MKKCVSYVWRGGAVVACWTHNPKVGGSKPSLAKHSGKHSDKHSDKHIFLINLIKYLNTLIKYFFKRY